MEALQGEARETVRQYEISRKTYPLVVAHLKKKYGDRQALIDQMIRRLQGLRAQSSRLEDQEKLCEQISSIVSQLQLKGGNVDNVFLQKQLLGKFTEDIQRHLLRRKEQQCPDDAWTTSTLLQWASEYIGTELRVTVRVEKASDLQIWHTKQQGRNVRKERPPTSSRRQYACFYCNKQDHSPKDCNYAKTREERIAIIQKRKLCRNCGADDHAASSCIKGACRQCNQHGHHTSLCPELHPKTQTSNVHETKPTPKIEGKTAVKRTSQKSATTAKVHTLECEQGTTQELLPETAAVVNLQHCETRVHILVGRAQVLNPSSEALESVHVMLDTGADRSFISNDLASRLQLEDQSTVKLDISTFGSQQPMTKICGVTTLRLWDALGQTHKFTVTKIDKVTSPLPRARLSEEDKRYLHENNIHLSLSLDVTDIQPHVLLGCGDLYSLLDQGLGAQKTLPSGLRLISSRLGYLVSGKDSGRIEEEDSAENVSTDFELSSVEADDEPHSWEEFCAFEANGAHECSGSCVDERKRRDEQVWDTFKRTIERKEDGYHVGLPWKSETVTLPDNKAIAIRRLKATVAKLAGDPEILQQYQATITDQHEKGIIEEIDERATPEGTVVHYLAHHAVLTPHKETTKLRVVFDGSAHLKGQPSLNDMLHTGPILLPKICDILMRFRIGKIAIVSDVEKAFLQIHLHRKDRDATRFLWLRDATQPLNSGNVVVYRFARVTFGLNCSPFLLAGTIKHHLETSVKDTSFAKAIADNTYVDNVIVTTASQEEAFRFYEDSKNLFKELNMNLREFRSNDDTTNKKFYERDASKNVLQKVLGVWWHTDDDEMILQCKYSSKSVTTKRSISEQVASVYDPLGLLTPLTLRGKQFLQKLWTFDYTWDTTLKEEHQREWERIARDAEGFQIKIPRMVSQVDKPTTLVLFADASRIGMAACAYIVTDGQCQLLFGKSKLPSLKDNPPIPKLELNALTLATRLAHTVYCAISQRVQIRHIILLSDSEIALNWIRSSSVEKSAGVLIRNRVSEIRKIVSTFEAKVQFGYVNTNENPVDCGTRGVTKEEFYHHLWWRGPKFLTTPIDSWPEECHLFQLHFERNDNETCVMTTVSKDSQEVLDWSRHNRLSTATRAVAYALRFLSQLSKRVSVDLRTRIEESIPEIRFAESREYITAVENDMALRVVVRQHQRCYYTEERLRSLKQLNVHADENGILRCHGRIGKALISRDVKQPMLIAPKTDFARAIVNDAHLPYHSSTGQIIANVRQRFWIPKVRQMAKNVLRACVPCQKMNNLPFKYPEMDDLPERRVHRTRPYEHIGIDYFGPIAAKRNDSTTKAYGIILTCTTTRLLHLELVPDMSTDQLLLALRRFFARRGVPVSITSDNGPSFLLSEQILRDAVLPVVNDVSLARSMATKGIRWKTITPYAPWQGAFYERLIKSVKYSLYKVIQRAVVSMEVLETLLVEIEGTLNSRPLTYQEECWEDSPILRPIDFIQRDMILTFPFESITDEEKNEEYLPGEEVLQLRTRKQAEEALKSSHQLTEQYWRIWSEQYLLSLREAHKLSINNKRSSASTPAIGKIVLIADPVMPRNSWILARILELSSTENKVREARLKLPSGRILRRPINLLIPIELDDSMPTNVSGDNTAQQPEIDDKEKQHNQVSKSGYNLRPRKPVKYTADRNKQPSVAL